MNSYIFLIDGILSGKYTTQQFCDLFEEEFNFGNQSEFSEKNKKILQDIFNYIVFFSPYENDRITYPSLKSEDDVLQFVKVKSKLLWNYGDSA